MFIHKLLRSKGLSPHLVTRHDYKWTVDYYLDTRIWLLSAYYYHVFHCYLETSKKLTTVQISEFINDATRYAKSNYSGPVPGNKSELIIFLVIISPKIDNNVTEFLKDFKGKAIGIRQIPIIYLSATKKTIQPGIRNIWGWPFFMIYRQLALSTTSMLDSYI